MTRNALSREGLEELFGILEARFEKHANRHEWIVWADVRARLDSEAEKLFPLSEMERTGGEPDVVEHDGKTGESEDQYRRLQLFGNFDTKTSSWIRTPDEVRALGGALFGDCRYGRVFTYHNGADSYYAARGFRGSFRV